MAFKRLEFKQEVQQRIGDQEAVLTTDPELNRWLNLAVSAIWRHWPWPFARVESTVPTVSGTATVDLPANYLRVTKVLNLTDKYALRPKPDRWLQDVYVGATDGSPVYYTDGGLDRVDKKSAPTRRLKLYPTPGKVYSLMVAYLSAADTMDEDDDYPPTPQEFDEAIVLKVLTWFYRKIDDFQQHDAHARDFEAELARLVEVFGTWQAETFPVVQQDVGLYGLS